MGRTTARRSLLVSLLCLTAAVPACARMRASIEPEKPAGTAGIDSSTARLEAISLAAQLAASGKARQSPLALLAAAELLVQAAPQPMDPSIGFSGTDATATSKASAAPALDAISLVAAAEAMGAGDTRISDQAARIRQSASMRDRGATLGPKGPVFHNVPADARHTWRITFNAGEAAMARVRGDGDTDLDCYVYDGMERIVALDDDFTDYCVLNWVPSKQQQYRIVIVNRGDVYNRYAFWTN